MTIEQDIDAALKAANMKAFHKAAPQHEKPPFTVYVRVQSIPLNTLAGDTGEARSDFVFQCWGMTQAEAINLRNDVVDALESSATSLPMIFRLPSDESVFDEETSRHMEPCSFSLWHDT